MAKKNLDLSNVSVDSLFTGSDSGLPSLDIEDTQDLDNTDPETIDTEDEDQDAAPIENTDADADDDDSDQELPANTADSVETSLVEEIQQKLGYDLGPDLELEDSVDGIVSLTKATAEKMAQEQQEAVFGAFPDVKQYLQYRMNGGDPQEYFKAASAEVDYLTMSITSEDTLTQKRVVGMYLQAQGFEDSEITETLEDYEDAGILERHAKKALTRMQTEQSGLREKLLKQQEELAQKQSDENEKTWTGIQETISNGSLRGISVPERDKKRFFDWMAVPVDRQGNSQRSLDRERMDQETMLALEYLVYKGLDLSKLVSNTATTQKAQSLRSKLSQGGSTTSRMKSSRSGQTKATSIPDLNDLI